MLKTNYLSKLRLLPYHEYLGVDRYNPLRFYFWPVIGRMYRRRIELCLAECTGGQRVLDVGFGAGVTFLNLHHLYKEIYGMDLNASVDDVAGVFKKHHIETHLQNSSVLSMPYADGFFDTVLLISILEHLRPSEQAQAFCEVRRVLRPGGQAIYGVPIERRFMVVMFWLLGFNIREHHFSNQKDVFNAANGVLKKVKVIRMQSVPSFFGPVYEIGHFAKD
jgi:ubiquinone/menaquinone biosynthesis C-methylase UbiE